MPACAEACLRHLPVLRPVVSGAYGAFGPKYRHPNFVTYKVLEMNEENSRFVPSETIQKWRNQRRSDRRRRDTVSQALKHFDDLTRDLPLGRTYRARCRDLIRGSARPSVTARKLGRGGE